MKNVLCLFTSECHYALLDNALIGLTDNGWVIKDTSLAKIQYILLIANMKKQNIHNTNIEHGQAFILCKYYDYKQIDDKHKAINFTEYTLLDNGYYNSWYKLTNNNLLDKGTNFGQRYPVAYKSEHELMDLIGLNVNDENLTWLKVKTLHNKSNEITIEQRIKELKQHISQINGISEQMVNIDIRISY